MDLDPFCSNSFHPDAHCESHRGIASGSAFMANRQLKLKVSQVFKPPAAPLQTLRNWSHPRQTRWWSRYVGLHWLTLTVHRLRVALQNVSKRNMVLVGLFPTQATSVETHIETHHFAAVCIRLMLGSLLHVLKKWSSSTSAFKQSPSSSSRGQSIDCPLRPPRGRAS